MSEYDRPNELRRLVKEWLKLGKDILPDELQSVFQEDRNWLLYPRPRLIERYELGVVGFHLHV